MGVASSAVARCVCFRPWSDADNATDSDMSQNSQDHIMAPKGEPDMVRTRADYGSIEGLVLRLADCAGRLVQKVAATGTDSSSSGRNVACISRKACKQTKLA